ncbi:MAG: hypothetical protein H0W81_08435 [Chloroflexi bacterium]|nr:hypothetical protein [Chloroflexota bacterium]
MSTPQDWTETRTCLPVHSPVGWAEVDRRVTDLVLWAPAVNYGSDFVSARLRNYQFSVAAGFLADQAWVR